MRAKERKVEQQGGCLPSEVQIWTHFLKPLPLSMRLTQEIHCRQSGLHAAVALVTYSNIARLSIDTSKILVSSA